MLKGLLGAAGELAGVAVDDPSTVLLAALAIERYRDSKELVATDAFLEAKLAPFVVGTNDIEEFALFGFSNCLRIDMLVTLAGIPYEIVVDVTPTSVEWGSCYSLDFELDIVHTRCLSTAAGVAGKLVQFSLEQIPMIGGIVAFAAEFALGRAVRTVGLGRLVLVPDLATNGIHFSNQRLTLDLTKRDELGFLWQPASPLPKVPGMPQLGIPGAPERVADLIRITSLTSSREGLVFGADLHPVAHTIFEATAGAASFSQNGISGLADLLR